jgi:transposase
MRCTTCRAWRPCVARSRLRAVLRSFEGNPLNATGIGAELGVSRTTAASWVRAFDAAGLVRLLPFYGGGRRPLLSRHDREPLIRRIRQIVPDCRFFWWKTGRVRTIELIVETGKARIGFCFDDTGYARRRDWLPLVIAARRGVIQYGYVLDPGPRACFACAHVRILPSDLFLRDAAEWLLGCATQREVLEAMMRINSERLSAARDIDTMRPWKR